MPGKNESPQPDDVLAGDALRSRMAEMLAHNGRFSTPDHELDALAASEREHVLVENREYWSKDGRLLPQATPEEMIELDGIMERLSRGGDLYRFPFTYKTPPGHRRELSCEMIINDGVMDERYYKLVIPENQWGKFDALTEADDYGTVAVMLSNPKRNSPRRAVLSAFPVKIEGNHNVPIHDRLFPESD